MKMLIFWEENFFSPLVFAKYFFVPKIFFLATIATGSANPVALMPVLLTSNFDDHSIRKNERASMETAFSHYKSMGNFLEAQGHLTPQSVVKSGRNSNLSEILCMSSLPASIKRIVSETTKKRWRHCFPHYKSMGDFCCHGNQSFDPICPKSLCSLSPTPVMLHIKFDQDWPTGFRDIQV